MEEIDYKDIDGSNWYISFKLSDEIISYLWDRVAIAEKNNIDHRRELAGNISRSLTMTDPDNIIIDKVFANVFTGLQPVFTKRIEKCLQHVFPKHKIYGKGADAKLEDLWVNFQKKYEFNPLHNHAGMFSFVIWMKVPYDWKNEKELPWTKGSNAEQTVGNFIFVAPSFQNYIHFMNKNVEGRMIIFPSNLYHMVYPFYTSDEERVSISGNIFFELEQ